jgi:hypothetical protein
MVNVLVVALGALVGFAGSRGLRALTRRGRASEQVPAPTPGSAAAVARAGDQRPNQRAAAPVAPPPPARADRTQVLPAAGAAAPPPAPARRPVPRALERVDSGERFELTGERLTIGRADELGITLADNRVSRRHAEVRLVDGTWIVLDLGSANGTRVGRRRLEPGTPQALAVGDVVSIGPIELRVVG